MNKAIFLCASMAFYRELVEIEVQLVKKGFIVNIPVSAQMMKDTNDFEVSHFKGVQTSAQKGQFIQRNFQKISESNSILVINNEKNGVKGYIGPNVLMEIGLASYFKKKIYIWNPIEDNASYKEELVAIGVIIINKDLSKLD